MTTVLNEFRSALAAEKQRLLLQLLRQRAHELTFGDLRALVQSSLGKGLDDVRLIALFNDSSSSRRPSSAAAARVAQRNRRWAEASGRRRDKLSEHELRCMTIHLTPPPVLTGVGATMIRELSEAFVRMVESGLDDQLLRLSQLKALITEKTGVILHCSNRTITRALYAIAKRTPLIVLDGRRWRLRFGELRDENSELLRLVMSSLDSRSAD
jgi:hypothetical protein